MKNLILCLLFAACAFVGNNLYAQNYHEDDKEGLREFLRQPSSDPTKINLELIDNMNLSDTLDWYTSEEWIEKFPPYFSFPHVYITWNEETPHRVSIIEIKNNYYGNAIEGEPTFAGILDCSYFEEMTALNCGGNNISNVNLSSNTRLEHLYLTDLPNLTSIDLSNNPNLNVLGLSNCSIAQLDLSNNTELTQLTCNYTSLASLDVSNNSKLFNIECAGNNIVAINFSNNPLLSYLNISGNQLTTLNLSSNSNVGYLDCSNNQLSSLIFSPGITLSTLHCNGNQLTGLNLSSLTNLVDLTASNNYLMDLILPENDRLTFVYCDTNLLTSIDVSGSPNLERMTCNYNLLTNLDVTNNPQLTHLDISDNQLTEIDLSNNSGLVHLSLNNNLLESLDVSNFTQLQPVVDAMYNRLKFSTIFKSENVTLNIIPQAVIHGEDANVHGIIDLSAEYNVNGEITEYRWYDNNNWEITLVDIGTGMFKPPVAYIGKTLTCKMTNASYIGLTLEYKVKITALPTINMPMLAEENLMENDINVYPNPTVGDITIGTGDKEMEEVTIYNSVGQLVRKYAGENQINLSQYPAGMYILKIKADGNSFVKKVMKSK